MELDSGNRRPSLESDEAARRNWVNVATLNEFSARTPEGNDQRIRAAAFLASPVEIKGTARSNRSCSPSTFLSRRDGRLVAKDTGEREDSECGLVPALGLATPACRSKAALSHQDATDPQRRRRVLDSHDSKKDQGRPQNKKEGPPPTQMAPGGTPPPPGPPKERGEPPQESGPQVGHYKTPRVDQARALRLDRH